MRSAIAMLLLVSLGALLPGCPFFTRRAPADEAPAAAPAEPGHE